MDSGYPFHLWISDPGLSHSSGHWILDACLWTLWTCVMCSLIVDNDHVDSGLWTWDSGLRVLNTSLSGIINRSPFSSDGRLHSEFSTRVHLYSNVHFCTAKTVDTSRRGMGVGWSVVFISEDFKLSSKWGSNHRVFNYCFYVH